MFLSPTSSAIRLALLYLFASETSVLASYQVSTCTSFHVSFCVILIFYKMSLPHVLLLSFFRFLFLHRFTHLSVLSNPLCLFKFSYPYLFLLLPFSIILIFHLSLSLAVPMPVEPTHLPPVESPRRASLEESEASFQWKRHLKNFEAKTHYLHFLNWFNFWWFILEKETFRAKAGSKELWVVSPQLSR